LGFALDFGIKAGFGLSYKQIDSNLGLYRAKTGNLSFGLFTQVPVFQSSLADDKQNGFQFKSDATLGFSLNNMGAGVSYSGVNQTDPQPRAALLGVGLHGKLEYQTQNAKIEIISLQAQREVEDFLIKRDVTGYSYQTVLSDLNVIDNFILGKSRNGIITKTGLELELLSALSISRGKYRDNQGRLTFNTFGFGVDFGGFFRLLPFWDPSSQSSAIVKFFQKSHLRYQFSRDDLGFGNQTNLGDRTYHGLSISLF